MSWRTVITAHVPAAGTDGAGLWDLLLPHYLAAGTLRSRSFPDNEASSLKGELRLRRLDRPRGLAICS